MIRLILSTAPADARKMEILLAGMNTHSSVDAFPMWAVEGYALPGEVTEALPHLRDLHDTWGVTLPGPEEVRTLALFMESVNWYDEKDVRIVDDSLRVLSMEQFHKAAVVEKEFIA